MTKPTESRRRFLKVLSAGGAVLGAGAMGVGCGDDEGTPVTGDVAAGNIADLPDNTLKAVGDQAVAIGRDAGGVYAMTLLCTHEQCSMATDGTVSFSGLVCNCHDSHFDANGAVTQGPATAPLEHYEVTIDDAGEMTIHADSTVSATTRTAVPA